MGFKQGPAWSHLNAEREQAVPGRRVMIMGRLGAGEDSELVKGPGNKGGPLTGHLHRPLGAQGWVLIVS